MGVHPLSVLTSCNASLLSVCPCYTLAWLRVQTNIVVSDLRDLQVIPSSLRRVQFEICQLNLTHLVTKHLSCEWRYIFIIGAKDTLEQSFAPVLKECYISRFERNHSTQVGMRIEQLHHPDTLGRWCFVNESNWLDRFGSLVTVRISKTSTCKWIAQTLHRFRVHILRNVDLFG